MLKTYKYRIYPNQIQNTKLNQTLIVCKDLYNKCLEERITKYKETGENISAVKQMKNLDRFEIDTSMVYSQVIQQVIRRLDTSFINFFRRVKHGKEKPGFPRFKSENRYNSFCYPQSGFKLIDNKHLKLSKIGTVKIKLHRNFDGKVKNLIVKRDSLNRWYVCFVMDDGLVKGLVDIKNKVGIDLGCINFITTSDGEVIKHPKYYKKSEEKLKKIQSKYSKLKQLPRDDKAKVKIKKKLNRLHIKVKNQRTDFLHKLSRSLVSRYDLICVEDLNIKGMANDNNYKNLNKSILDSSWKQFIKYLSYKAGEAGKKVVKVNPAYTSQICSGCGNVVNKELSQRIHHCDYCGLVIDRDVNASINILSLGTKLCGLAATKCH